MSSVSSPYKGIGTKLYVGHPHKTSTNVGVIVLKRVKCEGPKCSTFKVGHCVKCPYAVFDSKDAQKGEPKHVSKFLNCCVRGKEKFEYTLPPPADCAKNCEYGKNTEKCPKETKGAGAFTTKNSAAAELKSNFACDGKDSEVAQWVMNMT